MANPGNESWVRVELKDGQLMTSSNVGGNDQIALLEAAKFQVLAASMGISRSVATPPVGGAPGAVRSQVPGLQVRKPA